MSKKGANKQSFRPKSPAMKNWHKTYASQKQDSEKADTQTINRSEFIMGLIFPMAISFCSFMINGTMNSDDDWGIIAVFAIALIVWPIAAIVLAIRYYLKENNDRMIGAICSFLLVFVIIALSLWYELNFES